MATASRRSPPSCAARSTPPPTGPGRCRWSRHWPSAARAWRPRCSSGRPPRSRQREEPPPAARCSAPCSASLAAVVLGYAIYAGAVRINLGTLLRLDRRLPDPGRRRGALLRRPRPAGGRLPARPEQPRLRRLGRSSRRPGCWAPCSRASSTSPLPPPCSRPPSGCLRRDRRHPVPPARAAHGRAGSPPHSRRPPRPSARLSRKAPMNRCAVPALVCAAARWPLLAGCTENAPAGAGAAPATPQRSASPPPTPRARCSAARPRRAP